MFCKNCGNQIPEGVKFCSGCGTAVDVVESTNMTPDAESQAQPVVNTSVATQQSDDKTSAFFKELLNNYKEMWMNYVKFDGRMSLRKYWMTILANVIASVGISIVGRIVGFNLSSLYALAVIIPSLGMLVRRFHDLGKEWTSILLGLIPVVGSILLIIDAVKPGQAEANKFGPVPEN